MGGNRVDSAHGGFTVNDYLMARLVETGIDRVFGVPGDYVIDLLGVLVASPLRWIGNCNGLNAGYAADGYARVKGFGVVVVTYGVGGFSVLNAVAGAYAEQVPLMVVSGAPHSGRRHANALVHHLTTDYHLQLDIFSRVTGDSSMIVDAGNAPAQINRAIEACISRKRPVYLEIPVDIGNMPCSPPARPLDIGNCHGVAAVGDPGRLDACVAAAAAMIDAADRPVVLAGVELPRFGLCDQAMRLIDKAELPFATTISSKSALPELHPQFMGIYQGGMSRDEVRRQVEQSDCVLSLGVWMTDIVTGGFSAKLDPDNLVNAHVGHVAVGRTRFDNVALDAFIDRLGERLRPRSYSVSHPAAPRRGKATPEPVAGKRLSAKYFYASVDAFIDDSMILLVEPGDAFCAAPEFSIDEAERFICQSYYASIGYCTPASIGVAMASPGKRAVVLTGDGAFQMSAQEVSTAIRHGLNTVFLLVNNDGYLIERLLHEDGYYNDIQSWRYHQLPPVFGGDSLCFRAAAEDELADALAAAKANPGKLLFIEAVIPDKQCSDGLRALGERLTALAKS